MKISKIFVFIRITNLGSSFKLRWELIYFWHKYRRFSGSLAMMLVTTIFNIQFFIIPSIFSVTTFSHRTPAEIKKLI